VVFRLCQQQNPLHFVKYKHLLKAYKQHNNIQTPLNACSATLPLRVVIGHNSTHNSKLQTHLQQLSMNA
jgi:hypothetical protein